MILHLPMNLSATCTEQILNQVQKRKTISKDDYKALRKSGLVEGRYPALYVSYKIAEAVGDKAGYVRNKGLDEKILNCNDCN